ncbi:MAG TPA: hypothetical protein VGE02_13905 [Gemmatimonadales bacterium]
MGLSPAALAWLHRAAVLLHIGAVVAWFGAVAYYLAILRPAMRMAGIDRKAQYPLLVAIKHRLRVVVGAAVVVLVVTGTFNAWVLGLLGPAARADDPRVAIFHVKLGVAALLILTFLTALPLLRRVRTPAVRGRLFVAVHVAVLVLGVVAAGAGVLLAH